MNQLLDAALKYLQRDWKVTPIHYMQGTQCSCGRSERCPQKTRGKHPALDQWQQTFLAEQEVRQEWSLAPWNIGILTGTPSGFFVLDIDPENGGSDEMERLTTANSALPSTYRVQTGSGGVHFYFALPNFEVTNSKGRLPRGIDIRGDGGQVIAPPSRSGKGLYELIADESITPAPDWLLDLIRPVERAVPTTSSGLALGEMKPIVVAGIRRELARLDEMNRAKTPDGRGYSGEPWDAGCFEIACNLLELCNEGGDGHEWARWEFVSRAPRDAGFTSERIEAKWASAERKIGDKARGWAGTSALGFGMPTMANVTPIYPRMPGLPPATTIATNATGEPERIDVPSSPLRRPQDVENAGDDGWSTESLAGAAPGSPPADLLEEAKAALRAEILSAEQLDDIPPPEPLIKGYLVRDSLARINGPSGHGKSFVALDMAIHVALGRRWHGKAVHQGKVIYIVAEGARGIRQRVRAWEKNHVAKITNIGFLPRPVQVLDRADEWTPLVEVCREEKPALIIVDTQARVTVGVEENSATEMGVVVHQMERLRAATEACVLLIHHEGKGDRGGRGSSAIKGAMQTELSVRKDGLRFIVETDKQKDDLELEDLELKGRVIELGEDDEGNRITSLVLIDSDAGWTDAELSGTISPAVDGSLQDQLESSSSEVFDLVGGTQAQHRKVLDEARRKNGWDPAAESSFYRCWGKLVKAGIFAQVAGSQRWLWLPPERRRDLVPLEKGKGFYAPPDEAAEGKDALERSRRRVAHQKRIDGASGIDMNEVAE